MFKKLFIFALMVCAFGLQKGFAHSEQQSEAIEINFELSSNENGMYFKPNHLEFKIGERYALKLVNTSETLHEFASDFLTSAVETEKIEVLDRNGNLMAEIVGGHPRGEIEVGPGAIVEWYFVPTKKGENKEFVCDLPGHRQMGMVGTVTIK